MGTGVSHARNRDQFLDRFGPNESNAAEIRAKLDEVATDHPQNTDIGTSSETFQLDLLNNGVFLKSIDNDKSDLAIPTDGNFSGIIFVDSEMAVFPEPGNRTGAFDDKPGTNWLTNNVNTGIIAYKFASGAQVITKYVITTPNIANASPKSWAFEGSNDTTDGIDGTWALLDTQSNQFIGNWHKNERREYPISNTTLYATYRLRITAGVTLESFLGLQNLELIGSTKTLESRNTDNTQTSNLKVRDIEISDILTDGTNSIRISNIFNKFGSIDLEKDTDLKLLLHFNGEDTDTFVRDYSSFDHAVTFVGSSQLDTSTKRFGASSLRLGTSGDYLQIPFDTGWQFWDNNQRPSLLDFWIKVDSIGGVQTILSQYQDVNNFWRFTIEGSGALKMQSISGGVSKGTINGGTVTAGDWLHILFGSAAQGGGYQIRINMGGTSLTNSSGLITNTGDLFIGNQGGTGDQFIGNIDELRLHFENVINYPSQTGSATEVLPEDEWGDRVAFINTDSQEFKLAINSDKLLNIMDTISGKGRSTDPADPLDGKHVIWQSDGTDSGDAGDIMIKINQGGTVITETLLDFSTGYMGGDMYKSVYDTGDNGIVDKAEIVDDGTNSATAVEIRNFIDSKSQNSGLASLDAGGKVPTSELPDSVVGALTYQGTWNATTNTPTLGDSGVGGVQGDYFVVNVAGTTSIDGNADWEIGDWVVHNGSTWDKIDNSDKVSSVNGATGVVTLDTDDITEAVNLYYTEARVSANTDVVANTAKISYTDAAAVSANTAKISAGGSIDTHSDVDTTTATPSVGDHLEWDGSNWIPAPAGGGGSIFGTQFNSVEDLPEQAETSTIYIESLKLTTPSLPAGDYFIQWSAAIATDKTSLFVKHKIELDDTTILAEIQSQYTSIAPEFYPLSGCAVVTLTAAVHDIDIDMLTESGAGAGVRMKDTRLVIWRIS